jgi:hypothetical protein
MSGTAALAAARKRRATPQPNQMSQSNQMNQSNQMSQPNPSTKMNGSNTIVNDSISEEFPKATNPAMLLLQHNMLIQRLQKEVTQLKENNKPKGPETDYKSEYLGLLEEMKEMKKVLLKVQSFSMETNLEVMKLKRNVNETPEKMDLSSITVNDIDMETINEGLLSTV